MEFKFDANQKYQADAISSVVDLFSGQPRHIDSLRTSLNPTITSTEQQSVLDISTEVGAIGNNLIQFSETFKIFKIEMALR